MRHFLWITIGLFAAAPAAAQDMPLSQILIDGEGWRPVEKAAAPKFPNPAEAVSRKGYHYSVDPARREVIQERISPAGVSATRSAQFEGLARPTCVALWPDEGYLVVGDAGGKYLWAFRIESDGRLGPGDRYYSLRVPRGQTASGVTALTVDTVGRIYACTPLGVQVFDPTGRLSGVLLPPERAPVTAVTLGGPDRDLLYVGCGDKVYARKLKAKGVPPVASPAP